ncbi:MAG: cupredoxin family copper-binding protein [Gammaproteobacteria bacterium]|nr:cupredoxin family copper-binding protein [Gammaproteobacteria bacterium]
MKRLAILGTAIMLVGIGLGAVSVTAVSASPYAYPKYPGHAYGTHPSHVAPVYGRAYQPQQTQMTEMYRRSTSATHPKSSTSDDGKTVTISQMRFEPSIVSVKVGEKVTWQQSGNMPHTVTANNRSFGSQHLQQNGEFTHTFDSPGIYTYFCSLHPSMQGVVKVVE